LKRLTPGVDWKDTLES